MNLRKINRRPSRRRKGFTLMEVLLVLVILVLLGGTASLFFIRVQANAYNDAARNQITQFKSALNLYRLDVGMFPSEQQGLEALRTPPSDLSNAAKWRGPYIQVEIPKDPWEMPYKYLIVDADTVQIVSFGADRAEGTADDVAG